MVEGHNGGRVGEIHDLMWPYRGFSFGVRSPNWEGVVRVSSKRAVLRLSHSFRVLEKPGWESTLARALFGESMFTPKKPQKTVYSPKVRE
jgi:hypothetical protein